MVLLPPWVIGTAAITAGTHHRSSHHRCSLRSPNSCVAAVVEFSNYYRRCM
ncbi:hypothetical protein PIB30_026483 [Stylosanthes scabra]|uniref:Secreted protein n=1 Tax=Stylosanthes scabra TaxID=79078 RepID=A0ABU6X8J1_9FABA|nr:hypothetical protein [Stylosanthes scabra]